MRFPWLDQSPGPAPHTSCPFLIFHPDMPIPPSEMYPLLTTQFSQKSSPLPRGQVKSQLFHQALSLHLLPTSTRPILLSPPPSPGLRKKPQERKSRNTRRKRSPGLWSPLQPCLSTRPLYGSDRRGRLLFSEAGGLLPCTKTLSLCGQCAQKGR